MSEPEPQGLARCPECLGAVAAGDEFCLQCGHRLAPRPASPPAHRVARSSGVAASLGAVLLLGAGVALAFGLAGGHGGAPIVAPATTTSTYGTTALPVQPVISVQPAVPGTTTIPILTQPSDGATQSLPGSAETADTGSSPELPSSSSTQAIPSLTQPTSQSASNSETQSTTRETTPVPPFPTTTSPPPSTRTNPPPSTSTSTSTDPCSSSAKLRPASCDEDKGGSGGSGTVGRATWKRDDWPANENGFACLIASRAANTSSYSQMQARRAAASAKGLGNLGLLFSDHFTPSLDAGYFVLYSGPFSSYTGANAACRAAHKHGYGGANVRRITT